MEDLDAYLRLSERIPGWIRNDEARALAETAYSLPDNAVIVEVGAFFGSGSVLLGGARKLQGSGQVHCVDPFDGSGDAFSQPHYNAIILAFGARPVRDVFEDNIRASGLGDWVQAHEGTAERIAIDWSLPVDLLLLDGDQSVEGARAAFEVWSPWLKPDGIIALHNSNPRDYDDDHAGHYRLAVEEIQPPRYVESRLVGSITFARKVMDD